MITDYNNAFQIQNLTDKTSPLQNNLAHLDVICIGKTPDI
jgi:hypothetical protein